MSHYFDDEAEERWERERGKMRLNAAAPALLRALTNLLDCIDGLNEKNFGEASEWLDRCKIEAHAAIASARGVKK